MSDLALYRKYRPKNFKEVLGQDHVVSVLEKSLKDGNIAHAYLFFGSRGTGKTSIARILAREIGCWPEDMYEIDAASNRGIDDIRELREAVKTLPFRSPYKVYIVDEVHMLTKEAFNALLKTLEEPPRHVVFVLATTEMAKLPDTIVSRCETYTFKKPASGILKKSILDIAKAEGHVIPWEVAELIATLGDGSFRDSQVILQKVLYGAGEKKITLTYTEHITAAPSNTLVKEIISAIASGDLEKALTAVWKAAEHNTDFLLFIRLILKKMRMIVMLRYVSAYKQKIEAEYSLDEIDYLVGLSGKEGSSINSAALLELINAYGETPRAYISELPLELALIKIIKKE